MTSTPTEGPRPGEGRIVLTYEDLERMRRDEEQRQQGKAAWRIPPDGAPTDRDGPLHRTTNLTTRN